MLAGQIVRGRCGHETAEHSWSSRLGSQRSSTRVDRPQRQTTTSSSPLRSRRATSAPLARPAGSRAQPSKLVSAGKRRPTRSGHAMTCHAMPHPDLPCPDLSCPTMPSPHRTLPCHTHARAMPCPCPCPNRASPEAAQPGRVQCAPARGHTAQSPLNSPRLRGRHTGWVGGGELWPWMLRGRGHGMP